MLEYARDLQIRGYAETVGLGCQVRPLASSYSFAGRGGSSFSFLVGQALSSMGFG
jgi:hypothetical protein